MTRMQAQLSTGGLPAPAWVRWSNAPLWSGAVCIVAAMSLAGCAGGGAPPGACVDDSAQCVAERKQRYKALTDDASFAWVNQTPTVADYGSGVRLFAFRSQMAQLPCDKLKVGVAETGNVRGPLRTPEAQSIPSQRRDQLIALSDDIHAALKSEARRRCGGP